MNYRENKKGFSVFHPVVLLIAAAVIYVFSGISFFSVPENQIRNEIKKEIADLFMREKFDQLDKISIDYRDSGERTSSGLWKLSFFYTGIRKVAIAKGNYRPAYDMLLDKADRWVASSPSSPAAYIAKGIILMHEAWSIRGSGYAATVTEQNSRLFYQKARETYNYLQSVKHKADGDPAWYEVNISVMKAFDKNINKVMSIANEGLNKFPYYHGLYFMTVLYLTPKWHGDSAYIEEFALKSVQRTREKDGISMYARIYWSADYEYYHGELFSESDVNWGEMRNGFEDMIEDYPVQYNIQKFAYYACLAKDKPTTQRIFDKVNEPILMTIWLSQRTHEDCRRFAS